MGLLNVAVKYIIVMWPSLCNIFAQMTFYDRVSLPVRFQVAQAIWVFLHKRDVKIKNQGRTVLMSKGSNCNKITKQKESSEIYPDGEKWS